MWNAAAATLIPLTFVLAACGDSNKPAVCDSLDTLNKSVSDLRSTSLNSDGVQALQNNLIQVKNDLAKVKTDAKSQFQTQLNALDASMGQASSTISGARDKVSPQSLAAVGASLREVSSSYQALEDAISDTC